ncbi:MAG: hypothetical protein ACRDWH_11075, partial [Acidimicrobiia bacterium]
MKRRLLSRLVAALSGGMLLATAIPVGAAEGDLASYFERAAAAEFSGDQVLACNTPAGVRDS